MKIPSSGSCSSPALAQVALGNVAIISALMMPSIVGFCGLGAEAGYWYYRQRTLQSAADLAAINATVVLRDGGDSTAVTSAATADATTNGWHAGSITVHTPPTSGTHQNANSVEVSLTENEARYFSAVLMEPARSRSLHAPSPPISRRARLASWDSTRRRAARGFLGQRHGGFHGLQYLVEFPRQ